MKPYVRILRWIAVPTVIFLLVICIERFMRDENAHKVNQIVLGMAEAEVDSLLSNFKIENKLDAVSAARSAPPGDPMKQAVWEKTFVFPDTKKSVESVGFVRVYFDKDAKVVGREIGVNIR
jgi:hypothetical protein